MVRSVLEYGTPTWSPYYTKDIELLEKVQNRCLRLSNEEIELPSLQTRRLICDLCEVYKYLHDMIKTGREELFTMAERQLGGHSLKLHRPFARSVTRSNFFSVRVVEAWNSLPEEIVQAPTLARFREDVEILLS